MVTSGQVNAAAVLQNVDTGYDEMHVFYVGVDGSLNQTWWDGHSWQSKGLPGAPASDPVVLYDSSGGTQYHVFYRDVNGKLGDTFWSEVDIQGTRAWNTETIPGTPVGNIAAGVYRPVGGGGGELHVFYVEPDGTLHQTWTQSGGWASQALPGSPQNPAGANGGLSVLEYIRGSGTHAVAEQHVFYVGQDGVLAQSWWDGHQWQWQSLPPGMPQGPVSAIECDKGENLQHALFAAQSGTPMTWTLQQSWWDGSQWQHQTLPGIASSPNVLAAALTRSANLVEQHLFHRSGNLLGQIWWDGHSWQGPQWLAGGEPQRLLGVFPYYANAEPELHVFLRDPYGGALWHHWWNGSIWQSDPVPTAAAIRP